MTANLRCFDLCLRLKKWHDTHLIIYPTENESPATPIIRRQQRWSNPLPAWPSNFQSKFSGLCWLILQDACAVAMEALRETNKFLQEEEPWMRKAEEEKPRRLEAVRVCLEAVYGVAHFLVAFLPTACTRLFEKLGELLL